MIDSKFIDRLFEENKLLKHENILLKQKLKDKNNYIKKLTKKVKDLEYGIKWYDIEDTQMTITDYL